jgi:multiple sugar transport system ATP-binding protein
MNFLDGTVSAENGALHWRSETNGFDLVVDAAQRPALEKYVGKKVLFGIRPEDMRQNPEQKPVPGKSITANVEVVEPMGSEIYLYLAAGKNSITARVKSEQEPEVNRPYVIDLVMEKAHYFDAETELAIV